MSEAPALKRVLSLPWLVFYGVGVTVGAGIFALIADIVGLAGDHAVYAFVVAGLVAAVTAWSYACLARAYPHAAGAAFYVSEGLGRLPGLLVGYGVVATAIASSSVIAVAFARHLESVSGVPQNLALAGVLLTMAGVAIIGVKESVAFAAIVTLLEVATLLTVIVVALPLLGDGDTTGRILLPPSGATAAGTVLAAAFVAFFAFIGFEDIVNMAEETVAAETTIPSAILWTLGITLLLYGALAAVAAAFPDRAGLVESEAPLAHLFAGTSGLPATPIAVMAAIAMVNGILVQIIMASRLLFGMARENMAPRFFGRVLAARQTPWVGIVAVTGVVLLLGYTFPLLSLAELTSFIILGVFALVNFSLFVIAGRADAKASLRRGRWWGFAGVLLTLGLIAAQFFDWR
jgi:basic amino acid/polyamine antiporter, APA family